jgi:hypothetical protein
MARTITIVCEDIDPMYYALVDLLARYNNDRLCKPIAQQPPLSSHIVTAKSELIEPGEVTEVRCVLKRLSKGPREFVSHVAEWCQDNKRLTFILDDIADATGKDKTVLKAHNRNVSRAMKAEGPLLWKTTWDHSKRRMIFEIKSKAYLDAMYEWSPE